MPHCGGAVYNTLSLWVDWALQTGMLTGGVERHVGQQLLMA